jgi:ADP-heptose:LPS heptosyltransferase
VIQIDEATSKAHAASRDAAARVSLARFGPKRLFLSRLFEAMLKPVLSLLVPPSARAEQQPRTILVLEYWYLGDFVMLTPFLKNLRLHFPKAHIAMLASPRVAPLLEGQGLVDEIITSSVPWTLHMSRWRKYFSGGWIEFFKCLQGLRKRRFDWGFTGRADIRENFILWFAGVGRRIGYGFGYGASLLTDVVSPDLERPHYVDRWLRLIEYLGKPGFDRQPELKVALKAKEVAQQYLRSFGLGRGEVLVGLHAGARNPVRQWGENNFLEVAGRLAESFSVKVLWFHEPGSPRPACPSGVIPIALPLREFLAVVAECRLLVCNDTGPMHLTTAVGVPVVAVFGPGMSAWWGPRSAGSRVVAHEGVWCRPCFDYCIFDQAYCLRVISIDSVFEAAVEALRILSPAACQGQFDGSEIQRLPTSRTEIASATKD